MSESFTPKKGDCPLFTFFVKRCQAPFFAVLILLAATAWGQHEGHHMHDMGGGGDPKAWRMPPHDFPMPPLPGIAEAVPIVGPFLAKMDAMDLSVFPEAVPGEIVEMADGETLVMNASIVRRTINGKTFLMYGYNGQYPGPLIKAERGSTVIVEFNNEIEMPTTVHWHGLRLDNRFDGVPDVTQPPVLPGESFTYEVFFPDTGIYWYHPHMREDIQQDLGLYGNMLVAPPEPDYYSPVNREEASSSTTSSWTISADPLGRPRADARAHGPIR